MQSILKHLIVNKLLVCQNGKFAFTIFSIYRTKYKIFLFSAKNNIENNIVLTPTNNEYMKFQA